MTPAEQLIRRTGITAAEAIGLAGLSPFTPKKIYRAKMAGRPPPEPRKFERQMLIAYEDLEDCRVSRQVEVFRNPFQRFAICEARWRATSTTRGVRPWLVLPLRSNALRLPRAWGADGSDRVPPDIAAAATWMLGATGGKYLDVVLQHRSKLKVYPLVFNMAVFVRLYGFAEHFMSEFLLQGVEPK